MKIYNGKMDVALPLEENRYKFYMFLLFSIALVNRNLLLALGIYHGSCDEIPLVTE